MSSWESDKLQGSLDLTRTQKGFSGQAVLSLPAVLNAMEYQQENKEIEDRSKLLQQKGRIFSLLSKHLKLRVNGNDLQQAPPSPSALEILESENIGGGLIVVEGCLVTMNISWPYEANSSVDSLSLSWDLFSLEGLAVTALIHLGADLADTHVFTESSTEFTWVNPLAASSASQVIVYPQRENVSSYALFIAFTMGGIALAFLILAMIKGWNKAILLNAALILGTLIWAIIYLNTRAYTVPPSTEKELEQSAAHALAKAYRGFNCNSPDDLYYTLASCTSDTALEKLYAELYREAFVDSQKRATQEIKNI
ncbi:MAG: hypothetical protein HQL32_15215, partial [Planctomycetes bacterium]|nr:hypothetical protein [Planctomycetota bacterium]